MIRIATRYNIPNAIDHAKYLNMLHFPFLKGTKNKILNKKHTKAITILIVAKHPPKMTARQAGCQMNPANSPYNAPEEKVSSNPHKA